MKPLLPALLALLAVPLFAAPETDLDINSPDFSTGGTIPVRHTCDGSNISPGLRFGGVPTTARSLALIVDDPDAPRGTFTHWIVWNIPIEADDMSAGTIPNGAVAGTNDSGKLGYMGPCPPSGQHRYYFRLYALDTELKLPPTARRADLERAMKGHVLAQATLLGRYGRAAAGVSP